METLTTAERIGMRKGREEGLEKGLEEGLKEAISDILEIKFGVVGLELFDQVEPITDIETLRKIRAGLKRAQSIAEAEAVIHAHVTERSEESKA